MHTSEGASTTRAVAQVYNTILTTTRASLSAFLEIIKSRNAPVYRVVHSMPSEVLVTVSLWAGSPSWRQMIRVISKHRHSICNSCELRKINHSCRIESTIAFSLKCWTVPRNRPVPCLDNDARVARTQLRRIFQENSGGILCHPALRKHTYFMSKSGGCSNSRIL